MKNAILSLLAGVGTFVAATSLPGTTSEASACYGSYTGPGICDCSNSFESGASNCSVKSGEQDYDDHLSFCSFSGCCKFFFWDYECASES